MDSKTIKRLSVAEVSDTVIHKAGVVKGDGINASSMGTMSSNMLCSTCGCGTDKCQGHFGHINFKTPLINVEFIKILYKVLTCVCFNCSRLLLPKDHPKYEYVRSVQSPVLRRKLIMNLAAKIQTCTSHEKRSESNQEARPLAEFLDDLDQGGGEEAKSSPPPCGFRQPVYKKTDVSITCNFFLNGKLLQECVESETLGPIPVMTTEKILQILEHISDEDIEMLGLSPEESKPDAMLWQNLLVPPVCLRPTKGNVFGTTSKIVGEDDLTKRLRIVLKLNKLLVDVGKLQKTKSCYCGYPRAAAAPQSAGRQADFFGQRQGPAQTGLPSSGAFLNDFPVWMDLGEASTLAAGTQQVERTPLLEQNDDVFDTQTESLNLKGFLDSFPCDSSSLEKWERLGLDRPSAVLMPCEVVLSTYSFSEPELREEEWSPAQHFLADVFPSTSRCDERNSGSVKKKKKKIGRRHAATNNQWDRSRLFTGIRDSCAGCYLRKQPRRGQHADDRHGSGTGMYGGLAQAKATQVTKRAEGG